MDERQRDETSSADDPLKDELEAPPIATKKTGSDAKWKAGAAIAAGAAATGFGVEALAEAEEEAPSGIAVEEPQAAFREPEADEPRHIHAASSATTSAQRAAQPPPARVGPQPFDPIVVATNTTSGAHSSGGTTVVNQEWSVVAPPGFDTPDDDQDQQGNGQAPGESSQEETVVDPPFGGPRGARPEGNPTQTIRDDGTVVLEYPDGTVETRSPDDYVSIQYPDGTGVSWYEEPREGFAGAEDHRIDNYLGPAGGDADGNPFHPTNHEDREDRAEDSEDRVDREDRGDVEDREDRFEEMEDDPSSNDPPHTGLPSLPGDSGGADRGSDRSVPTVTPIDRPVEPPPADTEGSGDSGFHMIGNEGIDLETELGNYVIYGQGAQDPRGDQPADTPAEPDTGLLQSTPTFDDAPYETGHEEPVEEDLLG